MNKGTRFIRLLLSTAVFAFLLVLFVSTYNESSAQKPQNFAPDEILVKFKDPVPTALKEKLYQEFGAKAKERIAGINVEVVKVPTNKAETIVALFQGNPLIEYAEPNYVATALETTNDPYLLDQTQWGMFKTKAADMSTNSAWTYTKSASSIKIAILDTGIDQDHPDLSSKITAQKNCTSSSTLDDLYGHGTHVGGIAGAVTNNVVGVAGMGYNAALMNVKVLGDDGSGYYSWVANCIIWATDNGAKVINMSLGGSFKSSTLENAVNYAWGKGVVLAAAAGNSGNPSKTYPAAFKNVIAVAATDSNDQKASWSSYGTWVSVAAPGVNIFSTFPNHPYTINKSLNYDYGSGTSMATPHVAGLAGLIWSTSYGSSNSNVRKQIEATADKISGTGSFWKYGRINALNAVTTLGNYSTAPKLRGIGW